jgi:hypothetical protein
MKTYKFYCDPGHGWLAVKIKELHELGILYKISNYSYVRGKTAYLEEDCDASEFFKAYREKYGVDPKHLYTHTDNRSPIRSYDSYNHNKVTDIALMEMKNVQTIG